MKILSQPASALPKPDPPRARDGHQHKRADQGRDHLRDRARPHGQVCIPITGTGRNYFDCRGSDSPDPCRGTSVDRGPTLSVGGRLFEALDANRPLDVAEPIAERCKHPERHVSPRALAQLGATPARLGKRLRDRVGGAQGRIPGGGGAAAGSCRAVYWA